MFRAQFNYDSGVSSKDDRFTIDMYMSGAGSNGGCGIWVGSLCDEPSIGCKDTGGFSRVSVSARRRMVFSA